MDESTAPDLILQASGIRKAFAGVEVLHGVDLSLRAGEIHGIVGQNGAGKSTLMKILSGVFSKDGGHVRLRGREVSYDDPLAARALGISMVFQELSLIPTLTVAQNLFLTREPTHAGVVVNDALCERSAREVLSELGMQIDPHALVDRLPRGARQMVEIAKALTQDATILILDEPTASLPRNEVESLFSVMRRLRDRGHAILYVSHHLNEVIAVCDSVTVLRDGIIALDTPVAETDLAAIVTAMIGKALDAEVAWQAGQSVPGEVLLDVRGLASGALVRDVSFVLRRGEILGFAGLLGSGRSELVRAIVGIDRIDHGEVRLDGHPVRLRSPADALDRGICLIPEDRHREGLLLGISVRDNIHLPSWMRLARWFLIDDRRADMETQALIDRLEIVTRGPHEMVDRLSGGNQQKVVVAKALIAKPSVFILDEPTAGIDVQAKRQILEEARAIAAAGNGVILISSELSELATICERVLVLHRGVVTTELDRTRGDTITEESLLHLVQPGAESAAA